MVSDWGLELAPASFLQEFGAWPEPPFEGALELVDAVQASVPAGFLSNMNAFQWAANYEAIPLTQAFAYRFLSFELGLVKPDTAIFSAVADHLPVPR
jgi:FMN phosphatase YigB (HAD superfamily)